MKLNFTQRIFGSFLLIFIFYTLGILFFESQEEKNIRREILQSRLDGYAELVHNYMTLNHYKQYDVKQIAPVVDAMQQEVRVSVIDNDGKVLYDNDVENYNSLENHLDRKELKGALYGDYGINIRKSASTNQEYLYYAKYYKDYYIRIALPFNAENEDLFTGDNKFIYTTLVLFVFVLILLFYIVRRVNRSIKNLHKLTQQVKDDKPVENIEFSNDEMGDIGRELLYILKQKEDSQRQVKSEQEKLKKHFKYSEEGLAIFDAEFRVVYANTHFIQYVNVIEDTPIINPQDVLKKSFFTPIRNFVDNRSSKDNTFSYQLNTHGKIYDIKIVVYLDDSFEVIVRDITKIEKNRKLKQEMTSNIAHELRTPVTVLRGYLETMRSNTTMTEEQKKTFLEKAFNQSVRLSDLIEDVSLLSKIEEDNPIFEFENVNMEMLINNIKVNSYESLKANKTEIIVKDIDSRIEVKGSYNLLFSAIQNLVDNTVKYAGEGVDIYISCYSEDADNFYFSYFDTGKGVPEEHLNKLFERFYRIDEGRNRATGGSGLGLSIVRNIIAMHKGTIQIKRHQKGGLEFLFKLPKSKH